MERGNILKWMAKEGDVLKPGDVLAEIETDKVWEAYCARGENALMRDSMATSRGQGTARKSNHCSLTLC